jgi:hypothetical protein
VAPFPESQALPVQRLSGARARRFRSEGNVAILLNIINSAKEILPQKLYLLVIHSRIVGNPEVSGVPPPVVDFVAVKASRSHKNLQRPWPRG